MAEASGNINLLRIARRSENLGWGRLFVLSHPVRVSSMPAGGPLGHLAGTWPARLSRPLGESYSATGLRRNGLSP